MPRGGRLQLLRRFTSNTALASNGRSASSDGQRRSSSSSRKVNTTSAMHDVEPAPETQNEFDNAAQSIVPSQNHVSTDIAGGGVALNNSDVANIQAGPQLSYRDLVVDEKCKPLSALQFISTCVTQICCTSG